jgi:hypothetical protein
MSSTVRNQLCVNCKQDLIRDCRETLAATEERPCLVVLFQRLVRAAREVDGAEGDVARLLESGLRIRGLIDVIEARISPRRAA